MTDYEAPELEKTGFNCPHCNAYAQQVWDAIGIPEQDEYGISFRPIMDPLPEGDARWLRAWCAKCFQSSIWLESRMVYPAVSTVPSPHPDMPERAVPHYEDARRVVAVSRPAGAAMARTTLEVLLREVLPDATPRMRLVELIDLADSKVSSGLGELLTYIRHVGNAVVHVDEVPDEATILVLDETTTEAVDAIFTAINEVVDEFVTKPRQTARFASLIPEAVMRDVQARRTRREQDGAEEQGF